ncbi:MAG: hypothetical protein ACUVSX_01580 [Aggregatilineales bacterium]
MFEHTERYAALLRDIAEALGLPPVRQLARAPGVCAVCRVTVHHDDRHALDSVATIIRDSAGVALEVRYEGLRYLRPVRHALTLDRLTALLLAWQRAGFDRLRDQPGLPLRGVDLWLLERAAGTFVHSVIVAPQTATGQHAALVAAVREHLPEALREVA